ncbi:hypothetical protein EXS57_03910 [Candidatus Kaiserbacteria bacterium]|nr:hypothetical protein [Candidatus Kaiserbacteria bacterium]
MDQEITDLGSFTDRLMAEKGLEGLDTDVRTEVHADLLSRVEDRINASLLAHLPSDKSHEFEQVLDTGDEKKIQEFISASIPNANEVVAEALMVFRQTYLND